jgi:hypothetical protein
VWGECGAFRQLSDARDFRICNDFGNLIPYDDYLRAFSQTRIPMRWPRAAPNVEPPPGVRS